MSELEDKINNLLNDPGEMERFASFAKSFMGGMGAPQSEAVPDIDPGLIKRISGMMNGSSADSNDRRLLEAMRPYLSEKRRSKMDRAMKIARLAGIAELAAGEFGGEGDV